MIYYWIHQIVQFFIIGQQVYIIGFWDAWEVAAESIALSIFLWQGLEWETQWGLLLWFFNIRRCLKVLGWSIRIIVFGFFRYFFKIITISLIIGDNSSWREFVLLLWFFCFRTINNGCVLCVTQGAWFCWSWTLLRFLDFVVEVLLSSQLFVHA